MAGHTGETGVVTAAVLVIGDEILSGRTKDQNIAYIAERSTELGIDLREVRVVPDVEEEIVAAVNALRGRYDHVFTTGGIGPTHDDITADAIAKAFEVDIDVDPRAGGAAEAAHSGGRPQPSEAAHGAYPRRWRADREFGVEGTWFLDWECSRHGGRAGDHACDVRGARPTARQGHAYRLKIDRGGAQRGRLRDRAWRDPARLSRRGHWQLPILRPEQGICHNAGPASPQRATPDGR
jgi:molybdenum cofactor synthesis domain-containing protein